MKRKKSKAKTEIKTRLKTSARAAPQLKIKTGMALKNEDLTNGALCLTSFKPQLDYEWDSGIAIGEYLKGLKNGVLMGIKCRHCNRILIPPRIACEWCFKPMSEWVQLLDTGTVNTFSLCYITWNMQRRSEPQIPAVIEIDGASKGIGILHLLGEIDPRKVRIGMRVKAVWKPSEERQGSITDIKYFKPV